MKRLFAWLPITGMVAGSILAVTALTGGDIAVAQECKVDNGGLCQPEGAKCGNNGKGRCKTRAIGTREFVCECRGGGGTNDRPPRSDRPTRPSGEPREEQEPQEEQPE